MTLMDAEMQAVPRDLASVVERARGWLIEIAVPLWARRGRTSGGLFAERMTRAGVPDPTYFRVFVQARHIFAMVTAGRMGWTGPWQAMVCETIDLLVERARRADGFYVHRLTADGSVLDGRADLYDQAFVLFALGVAGGALGRKDLFDAAEALLGTIEREWSHAAGGFTEGEIVDPALRRQNPHMHLLEAFSALAEESGRQRFADASLAIAELAVRNFIDPDSGALREYYTEGWQPLGEGPRRLGDVIEPGHCCEWAWLFERLAARGWAEGVRVADGLVGFARRYGICDRRGVMFDEAWIDGLPRTARARCWPQTERTKAAAIRWSRRADPAEAAEAVAAMTGLERYLDDPAPGLWRDKLGSDDGWIDEPVPGSSLYHIACAIGELDAAVKADR